MAFVALRAIHVVIGEGFAIDNELTAYIHPVTQDTLDNLLYHWTKRFYVQGMVNGASCDRA